MEIIKRSETKFTKLSAVTIGKFDGIHKGHKKLIEKTLCYAGEDIVSVMFTFDISETEINDGGRKYIYTAEERRKILSEYGLDILVECPFDKAISHMGPEDFFKNILVGMFNVKAVIIGEDFRFGYKRKGDVNLLKTMCEEYGVILDVVKKEKVNDYEISSTLIRTELTRGNIEYANNMLGRPYSIYGKVEYGKQLGRTLDMPTVNIKLSNSKLIPPKGVYASLVIYKGRIYKGVTNIGIKPTIKGRHSIGAETYILDFNENIYGEDIVIQLLGFIRSEMKFADISELKDQMHRDKEEAAEYIDRYPCWNTGVYF